jgi:hypothetical protein
MERSTLDQVVQKPPPPADSPLGELEAAAREAQEHPETEPPENPAEELEAKMQAVSGDKEAEAHLSVVNVKW